MTPIVNLHILAKRFIQLSKSAYFDNSFREFSKKTVDAIEHVTNNPTLYAEDVVREFEAHVWRVMQFVRGSRSNDAPHETQFALRKALYEWIQEDVLVSSAALEDFDFYLSTEDIWEFIERTLNHHDTAGYKPLFVRIGSPEVYKHSPLFCSPLFHELGHFVDNHFEISKMSILLDPPAGTPRGVTDAYWQFMNLRHRMEHFADLFSSCYCGSTSKESLLAIAPKNTASATHPSTAKRVSVIEDFLAGRKNSYVEILQRAAEARTGKKLEIRYDAPDVGGSFDDVLTYKIQNNAELFGIYQSGWNYLHDQLTQRKAEWVDGSIDDFGIQKTINDLIEKSIRNFEIRERFEFVANNQV